SVDANRRDAVVQQAVDAAFADIDDFAIGAEAAIAADDGADAVAHFHRGDGIVEAKQGEIADDAARIGAKGQAGKVGAVIEADLARAATLGGEFGAGEQAVRRLPEAQIIEGNPPADGRGVDLAPALAAPV